MSAPLGVGATPDASILPLLLAFTFVFGAALRQGEFTSPVRIAEASARTQGSLRSTQPAGTYARTGGLA